MQSINEILLGISITLGILNTIMIGIWKFFDHLIRPKLKIIKKLDYLLVGSYAYYRIWVENNSRWNKKSIKDVTASFRGSIEKNNERGTLIENNLVWSQNNHPVRNLGTGEKSKLDILRINKSNAEIEFICEGTARDPQTGKVRYDTRKLEDKGCPILVEIAVHSSNASKKDIHFKIENPSKNSDWWNIIFQNSIPLERGS